MSVVHICDICGSQSQDKNTTDTCFQKGRPNKYEVGQKVKYKYQNIEEDWYLVDDTIIAIKFAPGTHAPEYVMSYEGGVIAAKESDIVEIMPQDAPLKFFKIQHYNTDLIEKYWRKSA